HSDRRGDAADPRPRPVRRGHTAVRVVGHRRRRRGVPAHAAAPGAAGARVGGGGRRSRADAGPARPGGTGGQRDARGRRGVRARLVPPDGGRRRWLPSPARSPASSRSPRSTLRRSGAGTGTAARSPRRSAGPRWMPAPPTWCSTPTWPTPPATRSTSGWATGRCTTGWCCRWYPLDGRFPDWTQSVLALLLTVVALVECPRVEAITAASAIVRQPRFSRSTLRVVEAPKAPPVA